MRQGCCCYSHKKAISKRVDERERYGITSLTGRQRGSTVFEKERKEKGQDLANEHTSERANEWTNERRGKRYSTFVHFLIQGGKR